MDTIRQCWQIIFNLDLMSKQRYIEQEKIGRKNDEFMERYKKKVWVNG